MKRRPSLLPLLFLLCAALACGCVTTRRVGGPGSGDSGLDYGITVKVEPDGGLRLHGGLGGGVPCAAGTGPYQ